MHRLAFALPRGLRVASESVAPSWRIVSFSTAAKGAAASSNAGVVPAGPKRIMFLGAPGVGKGTFANLLAPLLQVPTISTGDVIRDHIKRDTPLGREMKVGYQRCASLVFRSQLCPSLPPHRFYLCMIPLLRCTATAAAWCLTTWL